MNKAVNKTVLSNGIRILTKKIPHVRSVSIGLWINKGARDENDSENGLSHFIEHMVFKGTKKRSTLDVAKGFDAIGSHTNAFTSMETTCFHAKVLDIHLNTLVDILSDIFLNPEFDKNEIGNERPVIIQEIKMQKDNPEDYIFAFCEEKYWEGHPLGKSILGSQSNVATFDSKAIKKFYKKVYQPDNINISAAGNIGHEEFINLLGPCFEKVKASKALPKREEPKEQPQINVVKRNIEQVHICISTPGIYITDPNRFIFSVLSTIAGGNMSSRLFQEIREKKGLAYSVYTFSSSNTDSGMFGTYLAVTPENLNKSIKYTLNELKKFTRTRVSKTELENAKKFLKGNIYLSSENTDNHMIRLAQCEIHFERFIHLDEIMINIDKVSQDDIINIARKKFLANKPSVTLLGPVKDIKTIETLVNNF